MHHYAESPPPPGHLSPNSSIASYNSLNNSLMSGGRRPMTEAEEAELLSRATSQAMIAARSILLSGGSQSTALSTAKAAAQSILIPHPNDRDTRALGKVFLNKRKAKRQAEVVASMALLSVKNSLMQQGYSTLEAPAGIQFMQPPAGQYSRGSSVERTTSARMRRSDWLRKKTGEHDDISQPSHENFALADPRYQRVLPIELPKNKVKTREMTNVQGGDPIYSSPRHRGKPYNSASSEESCSVSDSGSEGLAADSYTCGSETIEATTVRTEMSNSKKVRSVSTEKDEEQGLEPFFSTWNSFFLCGGTSDLTQQEPRTASPASIESRNDEDEREICDSDGYEQRKWSRFRRPFNKVKESSKSSNKVSKGNCSALCVNESVSSTNSSQLLKELNVSSDIDDTRTEPEDKMKKNIRESMEQVVLRALSVGSNGLSVAGSNRSRRVDDVAATPASHPNSNIISVTSSLTHKSGGLKAIAHNRGAKFRNWMQRRRSSGPTGTKGSLIASYE